MPRKGTFVIFCFLGFVMYKADASARTWIIRQLLSTNAPAPQSVVFPINGAFAGYPFITTRTSPPNYIWLTDPDHVEMNRMTGVGNIPNKTLIDPNGSIVTFNNSTGSGNAIIHKSSDSGNWNQVFSYPAGNNEWDSSFFWNSEISVWELYVSLDEDYEHFPSGTMWSRNVWCTRIDPSTFEIMSQTLINSILCQIETSPYGVIQWMEYYKLYWPSWNSYMLMNIYWGGDYETTTSVFDGNSYFETGLVEPSSSDFRMIQDSARPNQWIGSWNFHAGYFVKSSHCPLFDLPINDHPFDAQIIDVDCSSILYGGNSGLYLRECRGSGWTAAMQITSDPVTEAKMAYAFERYWIAYRSSNHLFFAYEDEIPVTPTPSPPRTPSPSPSPSPPRTPSPSPSPSPPRTPSPSPSPSPPRTPSPSPSPSPPRTPSPSPSPSPTITPSPSPSPSPTMTPSPSSTPTSLQPTHTPTPIVPTSTPTQEPECPSSGVTLEMPSHDYASGVLCFLEANLCNATQKELHHTMFVCLLEIGANYYFYPGWTSQFDAWPMDVLPTGKSTMWVIAPFIWPNSAESIPEARFISAIVSSDLSEIIGTIGEWRFSAH